MISKLMPLPMPYSSICSPSHIRNTVPAVIVNTPVNCQLNGSAPPHEELLVDQIATR